MDYQKELHDFFSKCPPGIVKMDWERIEPKIVDEDRIVQVVKPKKESRFTVYYFHRIYNDDRIYKCKATFSVLPESVKRYMRSRAMRESADGSYKWDGAPAPEKNDKQLTFF